MKTALLRLCHAYDPRSLIDDETTPRTQYETKALQRIAKGAEVQIDHDDDKVIGRVRDLMVLNDICGSRIVRWHCALVDAELPEWVKRGTGVSIGIKPLRSYKVGAVEIVTRGILDEVSVLSAGYEPRNAGAQVVSVGPYEPPRIERGEVDPLARAQSEAAALRAAERGLLYRPAIGRITAVR